MSIRTSGSRHLVSLTTVVHIVLVLGAGPTAQTLAVGLPELATPSDHADASAFETLVEDLSAGQLEIDRQGGSRSCRAWSQCLRTLRAGIIDVMPATVDDIVSLFPELQVLHLPYLFESEAVIERVFDGPFYERMRDAVVDRTGLRVMAITFSTGWRTFATSRYAVRAPDDIRGLTLWTAGSPVEAGLVEAFGGSPSTLPRSQLATALAAGTIDGATAPMTDLVATGLHEHFRYVTLDRHSPTLTLWLMNDDTYHDLPAPMRQVVQASLNEVARLRRGALREQLVEAQRVFIAAEGRVHTPTADERMGFLMAAGRVATDYMDAYGADWLVWLEAAIAGAETELRSRGMFGSTP